MNMSVERWDCYYGPMDDFEDGKYVLYSDYEKLQTELQALAEAAQSLIDAEQNRWAANEDTTYSELWKADAAHELAHDNLKALLEGKQ